jgi:hypothetical protein
MDKVFNQFRRIYADNGSGDKNFSIQEARLRAANKKLADAIEALVRASERLNNTAIVTGIINPETLN